jgi:CRP/FNR family transcriptional regulator
MAELMEQHKSLKNGVFKVYGLRIKKLECRLQDLLYKDSVTRISEFIINYIDEYGEDVDGRILAKNLLSHKDIASLTSTSRQTVSNVLSKMRKDAIIDYDSKYISKSSLMNVDMAM